MSEHDIYSARKKSILSDSKKNKDEEEPKLVTKKSTITVKRLSSSETVPDPNLNNSQ